MMNVNDHFICGCLICFARPKSDNNNSINQWWGTFSTTQFLKTMSRYFLDGKEMVRVFLAEAGQCRPLECCAHACARLHIFIPVFYCKLYTGEVIGLCFNKLAVYSPSTKLYTNCSPALSPQMSAASRILPGEMFRCSRFASSGRDGRWCFLGEGGRTGRAVFVCASLSQNQVG